MKYTKTNGKPHTKIRKNLTITG